MRCRLGRSAIKKGDDVNAMVNLGVLLRKGVEGVDRDAVRAVESSNRAIAKGNSGNAACYLAMMLRGRAERVRLFEIDMGERKQGRSMVYHANMMRYEADGVARYTDQVIRL